MTTAQTRPARPRWKAREQYTVVCAWCKQRECSGDTWGPRRTNASDDELSHGICPECFRREIEKMRR